MIRATKKITSLWKRNFIWDLEEGWKLARWRDFLKEYREMFSFAFPLFPVSLNFFMRLLATWIWFYEICLFIFFLVFNELPLLIDLEEFCFSQVGFNLPAVCVAFSRWAYKWAGPEWWLPWVAKSEVVVSQDAGLVRSVWNEWVLHILESVWGLFYLLHWITKAKTHTEKKSRFSILIPPLHGLLLWSAKSWWGFFTWNL